MAKGIVDYLSDDELPDLSTLLSVPAPKARSGVEPSRRSPRKARPPNNALEGTLPVGKSYEASTTSFAGKQAQTRQKASPAKGATVVSTKKAAIKSSRASESVKSEATAMPLEVYDENPEPIPRTILGDIPLLPRGRTSEDDMDIRNVVTASATSNNRLPPKYRQPSGLKLTHVDSLLLPLSKMAVSSPHEDTEDDVLKSRDRRKSPCKPGKTTSGYTKISRFVLNEARCNDDSQDSELNLEDEDEDTDLSGFIVDDEAELSFHDSSASASDSDGSQIRRRKLVKSPTKRKLKRGSPIRRTLSDEDEESDAGCGSNKENKTMNRDDYGLDSAIRNLHIDEYKVLNTGAIISKSKKVELIDLTSPVKNDTSKIGGRLELQERDQATTTSTTPGMMSGNSLTDEDASTLSNNYADAILKFSPPGRYSPTKTNASNTTITESSKPQSFSKTPPATPPRTPTKSKPSLKSPSKLLSPSKKPAIPHSPHRQSVDAFWDLEVVNTWNDTYSPKKAPLTSPKRLLDRFRICEDSEDETNILNLGENEVSNASGDSSCPRNPCSSPTKRSTSPTKSKYSQSPIKAKPKNPEKEAQKLFNARKKSLAQTLLADLDANITSNKLHSLAASTGGVKIIWSNTLRSTAGRANWRCTVTKPGSESPVQSKSRAEAKVSHYASIELAEKIVDTESRLVNTLAHEFCHLANFMVSGVRNQPHGREFKAWATKVTAFLREDGKKNNNPVRRAVEVTTKHAYVISYKYLWVCVGRPQSEAQKYLGIEGDGGCGGEYGRHSRSIDVEKQRCGRCKGLLVQVRPKPRGVSPVKMGKEVGKGKEKEVGKGKEKENEKENEKEKEKERGMRGKREGSTGSLDGLETKLDVIEFRD